MHKTLVIGGTSPIGYGIAVNLKKQIRTCIQIVDEKDLCNRHNEYLNFEEFIRINKKNYTCDLVIINLYDVLSRNRFQQNMYQIYLKIFNEVIEILKNNIDAKIIVITSSYMPKQKTKAYNEYFNSLNNFILDFLRLFSDLNHRAFQMHFLPILVSPYYINNFLMNKGDKVIHLESGNRDDILLNNILCEIAKKIVSNQTNNIRYTSENQLNSKLTYKIIDDKIAKNCIGGGTEYLQELELLDYLKGANLVFQMIKCDFKYIIDCF